MENEGSFNNWRSKASDFFFRKIKMDVRFILVALIVMAMFGILTQKLYIKGNKFGGTNALYLAIGCAVIVGWTFGSYVSGHQHMSLDKGKVYTVLWCEKQKVECLLVEEGKEPFRYETRKYSKEYLALLQPGKKIQALK